MKVLVDTCVWSLALRRRSEARTSADEQRLIARLTELVQEGRACILGLVRQEILSGIREKTQFARTAERLAPYPDEEVEPQDYVEAARLFDLCQDHGIHCGPVDILLCAVATRNHYDILTYDQGLERCIQVLQAEGLMK
jgi:predicted nucleic acid-binding protein